MTNNHYRLDIQGLRAVSVLLVFFAHAGWGTFSGGFIGVDVFFVISGYVITLLLLKEHNQNNNIVLHKFYARRLQRLLPVLLLVVFTTSLIALIVLTPFEQLLQYDNSISAVVWLSNIFFSVSDINYFAQTSSDNLYLHTWSLGIEEQFYLLWPFLLLFGLSYLVKSKEKMNGLILYITLIIVISIALQAYFTNRSSNFAFYLMPARAWQFGLGSLIAILHFRKNKYFSQSSSIFLLELSAIFGISMIFFSAVMFDNYTPYPNWQIFIPSIGTALVILPKYNLQLPTINKPLAIKPMVFLGNISYSFYLWHWPVLLFSKKLVIYLPFYNTFFAICLTMFLSILTYYVVENPIRKNKVLLFAPKRTLFIAIGTMALLIAVLIQLKSYSGKLANNKELQRLDSVRYVLPELYSQGCDTWYKSDEIIKCTFGDQSSDNKVVIFGDSILLQWFPALFEYYNKKEWQVTVLTKSGCPIINRPYFYYRIMSVYSVCDSWRKSAIKEIKNLNPKTIIIGNATGYPFAKEDWQNGTKEIIDQLLPFTNKVNLFAGTPKLGFDGPLCLARRTWLSRVFSGISESSCSQEMLPNKTWEWQNELAAEYSDVRFIELSDKVCPNGLCEAIKSKTLVYRDSMHLTVEFVKSLQSEIDKVLY